MSLLQGELRFATVPQHLPALDTIAERGQIDLSEIGAVDSAGVAYLLAARRLAHHQGRTLTLLNVPAQLETLLTFYGVNTMFDSE